MLRQIMPKGLFARTFLIVVFPIFLTQVIITVIFFNRHWEEVSGNLSANSAGNIALITQLWRQAGNDAARDQIGSLAREELDMAIRFEPGATIPPNDKRGFFAVNSSTLDARLSEALDRPYWFNVAGFRHYVEVRVQLDDGYLVFLVLRERMYTDNAWVFILWLFVTTLLLGYISIVFMRNQVRSITRLADAAEAFGRGRDMPEYKPSGAREVRAAGAAFLAMRQRIKRYINQRTSMLAGVSHDLRTPLTRMKLALAMMPESEDTTELKADVAEMEQMLEEYLAFSRDQSREDPVMFDLRALAEEIVSDTARTGHELELEMPETLEIDARRQALKRAIANLVSNGFKHAGKVRLCAALKESVMEITVDDDGPGIEPEKYDEAFKPFSRLDEARSQNIAGVGLGLTVVRDVVRAHGGEVVLDRSPMGGLRATMRLPV